MLTVAACIIDGFVLSTCEPLDVTDVQRGVSKIFERRVKMPKVRRVWGVGGEFPLHWG